MHKRPIDGLTKPKSDNYTWLSFRFSSFMGGMMNSGTAGGAQQSSDNSGGAEADEPSAQTGAGATNGASSQPNMNFADVLSA